MLPLNISRNVHILRTAHNFTPSLPSSTFSLPTILFIIATKSNLIIWLTVVMVFLAVAVDKMTATGDAMRKTTIGSVDPKGLLSVILSLASVALMAGLTVFLLITPVLLRLAQLVGLSQRLEPVHLILEMTEKCAHSLDRDAR